MQSSRRSALIRFFCGAAAATCIYLGTSSEVGHALDVFSMLKSTGDYHLPSKLTSKNTNLTYTLQSSLHSIVGVVDGIKGDLWMEKNGGIRGRVEIAVANMKSGNASRDRRMLLMMRAERYPLIELDILSVQGMGSWEALKEGAVYAARAEGIITINDVSLPIPMTLRVSYGDGSVRVEGESILRWDDFSIPDPSTLLSKLEPTVVVKFLCELES